jgi:hypothetical protein
MELAAAATAGVLTGGEKVELEQHLRTCEQCRCVFREYQILANDGFRMLAGSYERGEASGAWREGGARTLFRRLHARRVAWAGAWAASLIAAVGIGAWRLGNRQAERRTIVESPARDHAAELPTAKKTVETGVDTQADTRNDKIVRLQAEGSARRVELAKLRSQYQILQKRLEDERLAARAGLDEMAQAKAGSNALVSSLSLELGRVSEELRDARQGSEHMEAELAGLRSERDTAVLRLAPVETRLKELAAANQERERRLQETEQFLASDRDIRELMSARNLYIADVFDVDSSSRTAKPFGRIFYTRGKSLLFYAFDLDRQTRVKDTSTFQVWGQKETAKGESARPLDLGILYLDSESNRRWVMHLDNPQTLSEIDAVFVTVEPHGGSRKPTGRPFLFAMLRKEANHP